MLFPIVPTLATGGPMTLLDATGLSDVSTVGAVLATTRTTVVKVFPSQYADGVGAGSRIQIGLIGPSAGSVTISGCYVGPAASPGDAWESSSVTQITFNGAQSSITLTASAGAGEGAVSDIVSYSFDPSKALLVAFNTEIGSRVSVQGGLGSGNYVTYVKNSVQEADDVSRGASYGATAGTVHLLSSIRIGS